jgi:microsomal dipeptidase-like Zn-dependent dipeptidase
MIADLHCHYPMHLLPDDRPPRSHARGWFERLRDALEAEALELLAHAVNHPGWTSGWRVDLDGLERSGTRLVCSVLYWPYAEFDLDRSYGSAPEPGYFSDLMDLLERVEEDLREQDPSGTRHKLVVSADDLVDDGRVAFVHCVEGGFHLGPDVAAIDANVARLAARGVRYVTLAHLFFRGVAANAPAIPILSDRHYDKLFPQDAGIGLTPVGRAAVEAMYRHRVLIDVSHMRQDALDATFALLDELDARHGADPRDHPVIASHVGVRAAGPDGQAYNLTPATMLRIQERGGLIGLILSQHQLGETEDDAASRAVLKHHVDAIHDVTGTHAHTAIGTDLDGFIKPTLHGLDRAADLVKLDRWIHEMCPAAAGDILSGNAQRVLSRVLTA